MINLYALSDAIFVSNLPGSSEVRKTFSSDHILLDLNCILKSKSFLEKNTHSGNNIESKSYVLKKDL